PWPLVVRHGLYVHDAAYGVVVGCHAFPGDLGRPACLERRSIGHGGDVGVDQRASANRCALGHRHMLEHPHIEPAVPLLGSFVTPQPCIRVLAWVGLGIPAPAALEHEDAIARFSKAAGTYRATKAAPDDDCVEKHRLASLTAL